MRVSLRFAALSVALLLVAFPGEAGVSIFPLGPTTDDAVTVRVSDLGCSVPGGHSFTRTGSEIRVTLQQGSCPSPPTEYPYEVPIGELPAGQYRVTANYGDAPAGTFTFVVRNAEEMPTAVRPWAIPANTEGTVVHLYPSEPTRLCGGYDCSAFRLEIAGQTYGIRDLDLPNGDVGFIAPAHEPGPVEMRLTNANGTFVVPAALYYFDPNARADLSIHERVLVPVFFQADGAFGSRWRSEAVVSNPNRWDVPMLSALDRIACVNPPCIDPLASHERRKVQGLGYPHGVALLIPRGESDDLAFSLRIRDISHDAETAGSQVPVVRERDMFRNTDVALLDLPLDPRYRTKIRAYAFPDPMYEHFPLTAECSGNACDVTPVYWEVDLAPGAAGESTDVYIDLPEGALGWAFASITNNATQQVTVVVPDGNGGAPCDGNLRSCRWAR